MPASLSSQTSTVIGAFRSSHAILFGIQLLSLTIALVSAGQEISPEGSSAEVKEITIGNFKPVPNVVLPRGEISGAKFPVVDIHTHLHHRTRQDPTVLAAYVEVMNQNNIAVTTSLDGTLGEQLDRHMKFLWTDFRNRFVLFTNIDFQGSAADDDFANWACNQPDFVRHTCEQLKLAKSKGVSGLKFFKGFGLQYRNADGSFVKIDDERWDPIWQTCGELEIPVIMHTADPSGFFAPVNEFNERAEELMRHPDWSFHGAAFPSRADLHQARNRVIGKFPKTIFIAAHFANDGEDLAEADRWLDKYPNLYLEIASRINELGRQPYSARRFFLKHQDRIMFGTDGPWPAQRLTSYWRFLETDDEHFDYSEKSPPPQGLWRISGIFLPDSVLLKIYQTNAAKIIPGIAERLSGSE